MGTVTPTTSPRAVASRASLPSSSVCYQLPPFREEEDGHGRRGSDDCHGDGVHGEGVEHLRGAHPQPDQPPHPAGPQSPHLWLRPLLCRRSCRSLDGPSVSQSELTGGMCFLMYTSGDESKFDCVQRTVCEDPYLASDYLTAAKMWYKMHNMLKSIV